MTAAGWIFAELYFRNKPESFYTFRDEEAQKEDEAAPSIDDDKDLPGTFASLMPLVVPIVLILLNTTCGMILPEDSPILSIVSFVGVPTSLWPSAQSCPSYPGQASGWQSHHRHHG